MSTEEKPASPTSEADNIADETIDEQMRAFIQELKDSVAEPKKTPSSADLYAEHLLRSLNENRSADYDVSLDGVAATLGNVGKYPGIGRSKYQADVSDYLDFPSTKTKTCSRLNDDLSDAVNQLSEQVDEIYSLAKSTDQQMDDLYEKSLTNTDVLEEIRDQLRAHNIGMIDLAARLNLIESSQKSLAAEQAKIITMLETLLDLKVQTN